MMMVNCSALYEVDFLSSRFRFFEIEFFYSLNVKLRAARFCALLIGLVRRSSLLWFVSSTLSGQYLIRLHRYRLDLVTQQDQLASSRVLPVSLNSKR